MKPFLKPVALLAVVALCLFEFVLDRQSGIFRECEAVLLQTQWMLLVCLAIWCGTFLLLTFSLKDLPLIGLLLIAIIAFFISQAEGRQATDAVTLLFGVTLGKEAVFALKSGKDSVLVTRHLSLVTFLFGLVLLLAFSSFWHLDTTDNFYHGPRWMGLWNNPNDYGLLMSAGLVLAVGLLLGERSRPGCCSTRRASNTGDANDEALLATRGARVVPIFLFVAALMLGIGLLFSYSRGAWVGTVIGLLYLAKCYGKLKWRWVLPPVLVALVVICVFWDNTPDTAPWFVKRLDLGRESAQHRLAAWKAGFEIMRDHPFGVGWNRAVEAYAKSYSPPDGGAAAITTNDYLMLGTQLGIPGLICFVTYVGLCLGAPASCRRVATKVESAGKMPALPAACRAGALAMLVMFWFDGGLFKLATASVFWVLLELGGSEMGVGRWGSRW